ncbi:MAG: hypothetical protein ACREOI_33235 [bacterium]
MLDGKEKAPGSKHAHVVEEKALVAAAADGTGECRSLRQKRNRYDNAKKLKALNYFVDYFRCHRGTILLGSSTVPGLNRILPE